VPSPGVSAWILAIRPVQCRSAVSTISIINPNPPGGKWFSKPNRIDILRRSFDPMMPHFDPNELTAEPVEASDDNIVWTVP